MCPSKHVYHRYRRAATPVAVAIASGALLCTAAAGPALASTRPSPPAKPAAHSSRPPAHGKGTPAEPPDTSGSADYYIVAVKGKKPVIYELVIKAGQGGPSLTLIRLSSGRSVPPGGEVIQPGRALVLPANVGAPAVPPRQKATVPAAIQAAFPGWRPAASGAGTAAGNRRARAQEGPAASTAAQLAWDGGIGVATLLAVGLLLLWRREHRTGQPDRRNALRRFRFLRRDSAGGRRLPTASDDMTLHGGMTLDGDVPPPPVRSSDPVGSRSADSTREEPPGAGAQRHHVVSGDDRIEVVLAEAPATTQRGGSDRPASSPLVWTPLPYDVPAGGVAFACLGSGDEGCLFIDLAAAPGVICIGGDGAAAARLAESIAHQLSSAGEAGHRLAVTVVGEAVPKPLPAGVTEVATVAGLGPAGHGVAAGIVFCAPRTDEETLALARYAATAQHQVIPVVLADLPYAPWSFTAQLSVRPSQPLAW
jgi:hypothetical protein